MRQGWSELNLFLVFDFRSRVVDLLFLRNLIWILVCCFACHYPLWDQVLLLVSFFVNEINDRCCYISSGFIFCRILKTTDSYTWPTTVWLLMIYFNLQSLCNSLWNCHISLQLHDVTIKTFYSFLKVFFTYFLASLIPLGSFWFLLVSSHILVVLLFIVIKSFKLFFHSEFLRLACNIIGGFCCKMLLFQNHITPPY